jgi:hypothetical protein
VTMPPLGAWSEPGKPEAEAHPLRRRGAAHRREGTNPATSRRPNFMGLLVFVSSYDLVLLASFRQYVHMLVL